MLGGRRVRIGEEQRDQGYLNRLVNVANDHVHRSHQEEEHDRQRCVVHGYNLIDSHHLRDELLHLPVRDDCLVKHCSSGGIICWNGDEESYRSRKRKEQRLCLP